MEQKNLKNKILISACLCGVNCRYDGKHKLNKQALQLIQSGKAIAICPEILVGLPVPRAAADIIDGRVIEKGGKDVTDIYNLGAREAYNFCQSQNITVEKAILKKGSPSCGQEGVFSNLLKSKGVEVEYADKT